MHRTMENSDGHSLFEKFDFGRYYYVLQFGSRLKINQPFTEWQLAEFLLDNDPHYRNFYLGSKKKRADRIESVLKTAKRHVEKLLRVQLMVRTGTQKQAKGTGTIPLYTLTPVGHKVLRTMQILELDDSTAERELFSFFQDNIKIFDLGTTLSFILFASNFTKKMYEKGVLKEYVLFLRQIAKSDSVEDISEYSRLVNDAVSLKFRSAVAARRYSDIWKEAVDEMPTKERELYLHDLKVTFDAKMSLKAVTRKYEELRIGLVKETDTIVLEGDCENCRNFAIFPINVVDYMKRLGDSPLALTCPNYKSQEQTLHVPNLWD